jgi:hypothetical protein
MTDENDDAMCVNAVLHSNTIVTKRKIESIVPRLFHVM